MYEPPVVCVVFGLYYVVLECTLDFSIARSEDLCAGKSTAAATIL